MYVLLPNRHYFQYTDKKSELKGIRHCFLWHVVITGQNYDSKSHLTDPRSWIYGKDFVIVSFQKCRICDFSSAGQGKDPAPLPLRRVTFKYPSVQRYPRWDSGRDLAARQLDGLDLRTGLCVAKKRNSGVNFVSFKDTPRAHRKKHKSSNLSKV